nr:reverse transcriptase domain-containing protein [Tanacetum cinerariifolium]
SSSTPAISSDVAELKDMVRALLLDKKNQSLALAPSLTPAPVKPVKPNCVTCGGSETLPSNTITNPKEDLKGITTRSGVSYQGPPIPTPSKVVKQGTEVTKDRVQTPSSQSTAPVQPPVVQSETQTPVSEPVVAPVSAPMPNLKPSILYPSRRNNERRRDQANKQIEKFYEIFKDMSFEISFTDALILMPKFASTLKALIGNKEKLRMDECLALADLGASINLMPLSVWEGLLLLKLTPTCMTLELTDRSVSKQIGITKDVSVKVAITYNLDQTSKYSANYNQMTANKIDVIDMACEEYSQEVLGFFDVTASGNPTPYDDPIVSTTSPTLTPFGDTDFLLFEEADAFLAILNSEPLPPLPNHEQYMPSFKKELKVCEVKTVKFSVDEPPKVKLKDLPPHLEYAFLEGDNKLPVIIAKKLGDKEKSALIKVLKSHKRAIAWKLYDIQGINPEFYTHKILMEEDYKPAVQHQRRLNPKIHDVIKKEVEKHLDAGLIYPISDSPRVSPVHCVPKKGGFTVVENEENELIPTRLVTGWRGMNTIVSLMDSLGIFKFPLTLVIRRKPHSPAHMECLPIVACLSVCAMHRARFKGGIVLDHKISKNEIEVDKSKVNVIAKLPHLTTVKGAVLGQRHEKHFRPIHYASKTMTDAESNYTTTEKEMLAVVYAFEKLRSYLIMNKGIVHTDHSALKYLFAKKDANARLLWWVLLLQEFDFKVLDTKGAKFQSS